MVYNVKVPSIESGIKPVFTVEIVPVQKIALKPYPDWVCGKIEGKEFGNKRDKM